MDNQVPNPIYEEEIDLRIYILSLFRNWYWIIIPTILMAIATYWYVSNQPVTYKATALVSISSPSIDVVFDERITTSNGGATNAQNNDLPNLATSDAVIVKLFEQVRDELPPHISSFSALAGRLAASTETRSEIITLSGTFEDPQLSAEIVNTWSLIFAEEANRFFDGSVETSREFLKDQLQDATVERDRINEEWTAFQATNDTALLNAELDSQKTLQQNYINRRNNLELLQYDIEGIKFQLADTDNDESILSDLTLYSLQNRAFAVSGNVQFQISSFDALTSSSFEERMTQLTRLEAAVIAQQTALIDRIESLEPTILELQKEVSELSIQKSKIETERSLILSTYDTLARKVAEGEIEQNDTSGKAQVASEAIAPVNPEPRGRLTTSIMAGLITFASVVFVILALTWWFQQNADEPVASTQVSKLENNGYTNGTSRLSEPSELPAND